MHALQSYLECFQIFHPWVRVHCPKKNQLAPQLAERIQTFLWRAAWRRRSLQTLVPVLEPQRRGQVRRMPERELLQRQKVPAHQIQELMHHRAPELPHQRLWECQLNYLRTPKEQVLDFQTHQIQSPAPAPYFQTLLPRIPQPIAALETHLHDCPASNPQTLPPQSSLSRTEVGLRYIER